MIYRMTTTQFSYRKSHSAHKANKWLALYERRKPAEQLNLRQNRKQIPYIKAVKVSVYHPRNIQTPKYDPEWLIAQVPYIISMSTFTYKEPLSKEVNIFIFPFSPSPRISIKCRYIIYIRTPSSKDECLDDINYKTQQVGL